MAQTATFLRITDHRDTPMSEQNSTSRSALADVAPTSTLLKPGTAAPNFTLRSGPDDTVTLAGLRGRPVVIAFYPADWSPVCGDQMALYNEILPEFREHNAELLGISVDGAYCHKAFADDRHLHFRLLADFEPKGAVSRAYGAYRGADGTSARALFVIDAAGIIRWSYLSPIAVNPGADGILEALERLTDDQRGRTLGTGAAGTTTKASVGATPASAEASAS
jgi:peroxiredoxin